MNVDQEAIIRHRKFYSESLGEREKKFAESFSGVNPHSAKQVANLAYEQLHLDPVMKDGKITTDKKALVKLAKKSPEIEEVVGIRADRKLISTYIDVDVDKIDGRLRVSLNSTGAATNRLSSSESVFNCGNNIQNWPHKIRDIIIPEDGMMFTEADLKGADAMVVAYLSEDPVLIDLFEKGKNVHMFTATKILWTDMTEDQIKEEKKLCDSEGRDNESKYFIAKKVRHSGNYKGSKVTLSESLKCSQSQAQTYLNRFLNYSPNLTKWHSEIEAKIKKDRTLVTPLGRKRFFLDRYGPELMRSAVAHIPQDTVAHVLNIGLVRIYNEICRTNKDINILNQVHDSILIEHPPEKKEWLHQLLHDLMRVDLTINRRTFYIPVEIKTGKNWRDME
jgi:DNA polymerase-1